MDEHETLAILGWHHHQPDTALLCPARIESWKTWDRQWSKPITGGLIPGVAIYFVGVWARAWRWHYLLLPLKVHLHTSIVPYRSHRLLWK